jgi:type II secretory pathway pseudopilin PulG
MGAKTQTGFTIIEVMLFLAITGMLATAILVGSGVAIGQQRYRDSVGSLQSYIQQQYNKVVNVTNDRDKAWTCDSNGNVTQEDNASAGEARGTSDCVVMGRLVTVDATGTNLTSSVVVGYRNPNAGMGTSDIAEISANYKLGLAPIDRDDESVNWGAQVVKAKTATPMPLSILIVRSPLSGATLTFTKEGVQTNPGSMVNVVNNSAQRDLCVNADVGSFVGKRMEVRIEPFASSQSAVQVPPESDSVCDN